MVGLHPLGGTQRRPGGRRQRLKQRLRDGLVDLHPADGQAVDAPSLDEVLPRALIAGCGVSSPVVGAQLPICSESRKSRLRRRERRQSASSSASTRATTSAVTDSRPCEIVRRFRYPGGALWPDAPLRKRRSVFLALAVMRPSNARASMATTCSNRICSGAETRRQPADQAMPAPRTPTYTE